MSGRKKKIDKEKSKIRVMEKRWERMGIKEVDGSPLKYETYMEVKLFQNDECAICNRNNLWGELQVDHDHETGMFRGLLCRECNHYAVGTFERTGKYRNEAMENAIKRYLESPPYRFILNMKEISKREKNTLYDIIEG